MQKTQRRPSGQRPKPDKPKIVQVAYNNESNITVLYDDGRVFVWGIVGWDIGISKWGWREMGYPDLAIPCPPKGYRANG